MAAPITSPPPPAGSPTQVPGAIPAGSVAGTVGVLGGSALRALIPKGTPGRLRIAQLGLVLLLVLSAIVLNLAMAARSDSIDTARNEAAPLLLAAQSMKSSLADANAAAANAFLAGGLEQAEQRERYEQGVATAATQLTVAADQASDNSAAQIDIVATGLPTYTGLVETARANNRQLAPVGAAYLRQATGTLEGEIVPAIEVLRDEGDARLRAAGGDASAGISPLTIALLVLAGLALLAALRFLRVVTRRVLNVGVVAALALVGVTLLWTLFSVGRSASNMADARDNGYEPLGALSEIRSLAATAKGYQARALIGRGSGGQSYAVVTGLANAVDEVLVQLDGVDADAAERIRPLWDDWLAVHREIESNDQQGLYDDAVALATAPGSERGTNQTFDALDAELSSSITGAEDAFDSAAGSADNALGALGIVGPLLLLGAAAAVIWGIQQRVREYL